MTIYLHLPESQQLAIHLYREVHLSSKGKEFNSPQNDMYTHDMENFTEVQDKFQTKYSDHVV